MSASSEFVTCGMFSQARCKCGPASFFNRDSGFISIVPNFEKSCAGISGMPVVMPASAPRAFGDVTLDVVFGDPALLTGAGDLGEIDIKLARCSAYEWRAGHRDRPRPSSLPSRLARRSPSSRWSRCRLSTCSALLTAVANDFGFDGVFERQVEGVGREGDVLVGISTSGNSENVVRVFAKASSMGVRTIAMTGSTSGESVCLPRSRSTSRARRPPTSQGAASCRASTS